MAAYNMMPLQELFKVEEVKVDIPISEMPGPSRFKAVCQQCVTVVRDKKEVYKNGMVLCRPCAFGTYFQPVTNNK
jgi:formylmethanofuran dehydrogenase subunit E